ncbi:3'-5' exonuclease [Polaribacter reichenbachii]|uniref:3'-5' exonuclease n=1 Tax=Polaribacter reichenbachii TaxID=996801 RepID=A0A1B8TVP8_9FLAO|nr:3'-5' exonuclease [Polaribacter reichenbachii]APZ45319.1 3'-5' exonuclease [Polaribacter reichenbachii]AUC19181.1 3'-5' exonuclease [Polaribacter reichenbachii]OBY63662.1 3'-5' exonuclease [Polaribacter reichenbachii]
MNLTFKLNNILFLDIETVPQEESWENVPLSTQALFAKKTQYQRKEEFTAKEFYDRAGIWAEFGKIICISVGYFVDVENEKQLRVTSFYGDDEHKILTDFKVLLDKHFAKKSNILCAHNGKEFDFPFIARRMIVHQIELPKKLNLFGKKPWEVAHLDTLELWKFGDYKHYTSLKLLTSILGIPSPKDDIDGSEVAKVYYQEKDIERIVRYCEKDTVAVAQILLRFNNEDLVKDENIVSVD